MFTRELILKGDRGDGIPNILSSDDCIVNGERQKKMFVQKYIHVTNPREYFKGELLKNWLRNETLIDLTFVPSNIQEKIIFEFEKQADKPKDKLEGYFAKHNLKTLSEKIEDFL
jgi:phosphorylcholine metabolism protein LicD